MAVTGASEYLAGISTAIYQLGAEFSVSNSLFEHNSNMAIFQNAGTTTITHSEFTNQSEDIWSRGGSIKISQSNISGNSGLAIYNESGPTIDARNNWWGDPSGPYNTSTTPATGTGDKISGDILYVPFLTAPYGTAAADCCSSVLFLPGIKGSVLKKINVTSGDDTLWPPTVFSNDIPQLALNQEGQSVYPIVVDGILNTFYYSTPIYSGFSSFMDDLQTINPQTGTSTIKEWLPLAYDWRYSPEKIIADGIQTYNDGHIDVIERIEELAQNSDTGKITIVAHSMGGLLGKAIIKELENRGEAGLIDSFIMVGSPQLGTPQAVASLLHGDGEGIAAGIITYKSDIRAIAQNTQSAYNLLPSEKYFTEVDDPVVKFAEVDFTENWRILWGESLDNYEEFRLFATGTDGRSKPEQEKFLEPEIIRSDLLENAKIFHQTYDNFQFPDSIRVVQIAGWGIETINGINYKERHHNDSYDALFTVEGDKTVVYPSAVSSIADETYYFDLAVYNAPESIPDFQHRDILSAQPVQDLVKTVIEKNLISENTYIRTTKPDPGNIEDKLLVSTHSPVILGAYDSEGNFTGIEPGQSQSSGFLEIKEEISGSSFVSLGDSQYIFLPKEGNYNFVFSGTGNGEATVEIENFANDTAEPVASFTDIPITNTVRASFTIDPSIPLETKIEVDENGDGQVDTTVLPDNTSPSLTDLLQILKDKINSLSIKDKIKKNLLKKIDNLEKRIEKKKELNAKILERIEKNINIKTSKGKIDAASAEEILNLLDELEAVSDTIPLNPDILLNLKIKIEGWSIKPAQKRIISNRIERLEQKQTLTNTLARMNNQINRNQNNGKISDADANAILKILDQIESLL